MLHFKHLLLIAAIALCSCKGFKKLGEVRQAVAAQTQHEQIKISMHSSTSEGKKLMVVLYNYPMNVSEATALQEKAEEIDRTILKTVPEWKDNMQREVVFSSSTDSETLINSLSFKFPQ